MSTRLRPYLNFRDGTREVMNYYQSIFGGELSIITFKDFNAAQNPLDENKVMHAELDSPNGVSLMASDLPSDRELDQGSNISLSLNGNDATMLTECYQKLSADGQVIMPLEPSEWGDTFGMVVDRYGVRWLVNITQTG